MHLLSPASIAVIGASADEKKVGHLILKNLITQGYAGGIFAVNPKGEEILGRASFTSVSAIPDSVEMAIIVTPAATVEGLVEECGKKGVKTVVVISAGFRETGKDGADHEAKLVSLSQSYNIRLIGPNCLGLMRPGLKMNASFGNRLPPAGNVALLSQSGALADAFIDRASSLGLGLSFFVSMGNKAAMDECDFLELCAEDPETKVIGFYLESIVNGKRFLKLAQSIARKKPIVILKAGRTDRGSRAVSSHTGALAGLDAAVDAICAQAGAHRAATSDEFLDLLRTLSCQPVLASPNIAIITNAGGPGVLATDAAEKLKLALPSLSPAHDAALKKSLPSSASTNNPIDVLGDALTDRFEAALRTAVEDQAIDGAVVILTPQVMTPAKDIAEMMVRVKKQHPLFPFVACFMGEEGVRDGIAVLHANGIPNFSAPETAIATLAKLRQTHPEETKCILPSKTRAAKAQKLLGTAKGLLTEEQTAQLFSLYDLPLPRGEVATTAEQAVEIAERIGFPVIAKVSSGDILHKTDVGGIKINLENPVQVKAAFAEILKNAQAHAPKATVRGVLIQQCLAPGSEFIIGAIADVSVGHLIMVGLGGIYTELFADIAFRVAPVLPEEAYPMLTHLKSWKLLLGMRGKPKLAIDEMAQLISRVSLLVTECPGILELDLNPVLVTEKTLTILDAKVVMG